MHLLRKELESAVPEDGSIGSTGIDKGADMGRQNEYRYQEVSMENHIYAQIMEKIRKNESVALKTVFTGDEGDLNKDLRRELIPVVPVQDRKGCFHARVGYRPGGEVIMITEPVIPQERLIILGGGHVGLAVCEFAAKSGFSVTVCDDRPAFANADRFPWADDVMCDSFENCIRALEITPYDYVVIVTRGHVHDRDCLRALLPGDQPAYLGMIGSRRRVKGLLDQLEREGYPRERMDRISTPIGLDIGANTPAEIAVSIVAELICYKRKPEHAENGRCCNDSDLQLDMVKYLAEDHSPKAIVTVIETKGSTPRGAGAKMAVGPRGELTGSIGGGCSEGAIIRDAIDIIGTGTYKVFSIDMTGEVAEQEGMVCGGTMKVLVEDGSEL